MRCTEVGRRFRTQSGDVIALDHVSLDVDAGTMVAIAGPSGSGKTTLLSIIGCLDRPTSGTVMVNGAEVSTDSRRRRRAIRRNTIAILLPQPSDNLLHDLDGFGNLRRAARQDSGMQWTEATALLDQFDIADCGTKRVRDMSGGEQQRLALACALARKPTLISADEPTSSLDRANARLVIAAFDRAIGLGATVVVATHDTELVGAATSVLRLSHGEVVS
ncbi:MAG: transporter ATP-binding protein [Ilumatobacteraceae bacterium]|nr:transporter ATP-binding protein [Ilumatobacteraceae bacterium]